MSDITLTNLLGFFPVGTTVGAYADAIDDAGTPKPIGPKLSEGEVDSEGAVTLPELDLDGTTYAIAALFGGAWQIVRVTTAAPSSGNPATEEALEALQAEVDLLKEQVGEKLSIESGITVVRHGDDDSVPRPPVGAGTVLWVGSVTPLDIGPNDLRFNDIP